MKPGETISVRWSGVLYELKLVPHPVLSNVCALLPAAPIALSAYSGNVWFAVLSVPEELFPIFGRDSFTRGGTSAQAALDEIAKLFGELRHWVDRMTTLTVPKEVPYG